MYSLQDCPLKVRDLNHQLETPCQSVFSVLLGRLWPPDLLQSERSSLSHYYRQLQTQRQLSFAVYRQ